MLGGIHRRFFLKVLGAAGLVATTTEATTGCAPTDADEADTDEGALTLEGYEYVIVGSGAGGGPLAANLARAGHKVLLLEAGQDRGESQVYQVPAFHTQSTEDPDMSWNYYVKHYSNDAKAQQDSKFTWEKPDGSLHVGPNPPAGSKPKGILYPRTGTLGGCTAHNALVTVYPHESDWNGIADMLERSSDESDRAEAASWRPANMRKYYGLLERAEYLGRNDSTQGHGLKGWLGVNRTDATAAGLDLKLAKVYIGAAFAAGHGLFADFGQLLGLMNRDLNAGTPGRDQTEGIFSIPLAMSRKTAVDSSVNDKTPMKRNGPREFLLDTIKKGHPLTIMTGCFATRVIFDSAPGPDGKLKAKGVEFVKGDKLYRADPRAPKDSKLPAEKNVAMASREVILACGAYNTPQLLKLSGVGPSEELQQPTLKIPVKLDLKGVGTNLQDRYEVGVISQTNGDFSSLGNCTSGAQGDPCLADWKAGKGVYNTNGVPIGVIKKSSVAEKNEPDLIIFGGPAYFKGYFPGYSTRIKQTKNEFTWAILKAHTRNKAGYVKLKSADPLDPPEINFKYFEEGSAGWEKDLQAVAEGVAFAREAGKTTGNMMGDDIPLLGGKFEEEVPGPAKSSDAAVKDHIKKESWGHHASCTCPMGAAGDSNAVLDGRFKVRGTSNLRVVDASVFPTIPGIFIVVPIYMISEKATDVILEDAGDRPRI